MSEPSPVDKKLAVVASLMEPALHLARIAGLSLDDVRELSGAQFFRLLQRRGLSWESVARKLKKSRRTVAKLARQAASRDDILMGSERLQLRRRIVRALAERDLAMSELEEQFRGFESEVLLEELDVLRETGIVAAGQPLRLEAAMLDLLGDDFDRRLESLRHFLESIAHVVYQRFFRDSDDGMARVWTLSITPNEFESLRNELASALEQRLVEADSHAESSEEAFQVSVTFSAVRTPSAPSWKTRH